MSLTRAFELSSGHRQNDYQEARGLRVNAVSPTVLREAPAYDDDFPGFIQVPVATVAEAYVRSIEDAQTGRIYIVD